MNKELIKQVQAGTHCIEHTRKPEDKERLNSLLRLCFSNDRDSLATNRFYFRNKHQPENMWDVWNSLPYDLTPISLDDFFKEEEQEKGTGKIIFPTKEMVTFKGKPASPEQPTLPEVTKESILLKHVSKYYGNKRKTVLNLDDIMPISRILPAMEEYANRLKSINNEK